MTIICYRTKRGEHRWDEVPGSAEVSLETWASTHPDCEVIYQFKPTDTLTGENDENRHRFNRYCNLYGLTEFDFDAPLLFEDGTKGRIRGVELRRRKYVIRVWRPDKQKYLLYTAASVKWAMENARKHGMGGDDA